MIRPDSHTAISHFTAIIHVGLSRFKKMFHCPDLKPCGKNSTPRVYGKKVVLRISKALVRCLAIPSHGLGIILLHTSAFSIHQTEVALRISMALARGLAVPSHGLGIILLHASGSIIHETEVALRMGMALVRGLAIPSHGLGIILLHASAIKVH